MPAAALPLPTTPPPVLLAGATIAHWLSEDGEILDLPPAEAGRRAAMMPPLVCHGRAAARRLGLERFDAYDLLELYAFVRPARFCPPTPAGLAVALGLPVPADTAGRLLSLRRAAVLLLRELETEGRLDAQARALAPAMARGGWLWGPYVLQALGLTAEAAATGDKGYRVWDLLPEWTEEPREDPPGTAPVEPAEARGRLASLLGPGAEARPQQADYASAVTAAFAPRQRRGEPAVVLAEAGTGVGKTLGYIAAASLWAERNGAPVWLSTYTRNLQHQLDGELDRLFPDRREKERRVVVRKGRENYLCLLNYAERARALPAMVAQGGDGPVALGLVARWMARTRDGDMVGGDMPGWLADLVGRNRVTLLADRRGECIHGACEFYRRCFVERTIRRARQADLVVANHALVMIQAALGAEEGAQPTRLVFDEGHHLFDAADSAFAAHLSGQETAEMRRWLLGAEGARGLGAARRRGLRRRLEDLLAEDPALEEQADLALRAARALPSDGWQARLAEGRAEGPLEDFLLLLRQQVFARAESVGEGYSLECPPLPLVDGLAAAAAALEERLGALDGPLKALAEQLTTKLDDESATLESEQRRRIEALLRSLQRRVLVPLSAWRGMLQGLGEPPPDAFVDWFAVERIEGHEVDVGYYRHWVDPTEPFANAVLAPAHGALLTSATLTDRSGDPEEDWRVAEARCGLPYLPPGVGLRAQVPSPFDYARQTRALVVTDVRKDDLDQVAAAVRELFIASSGGALGLFTAISRLKAVRARIADPLEQAGVSLLSQHVDGLDVSTLVEIFRAETDSCLLGTDAIRDGVDVPGEALRLIVFDRVPWPRPDLRHKARRQRFGGRHYDDRLTRLKLRQAFGRLIRRAGDRGVFVLLDPMMPSRLATAFPEGVALQRIGLAEAVAEVRAFFAPAPADMAV